MTDFRGKKRKKERGVKKAGKKREKRGNCNVQYL